MSVLRNLEDKIAGLVEGTFGRVFRSEVRPVELARKLAKEMDEHRTVSVSRTYVPNEYVVWLSTEDRERYDGVEREVIDELGRLPARARPPRAARADLAARRSSSAPTRAVAGRVRHPGPHRQARRRARPSRPTTATPPIYSTADRVQEPLQEERAARAGPGRPRGRGQAPRDRPRRRHRSAAAASATSSWATRTSRASTPRSGPARRARWTIADLGSTNGIRVNGHGVPAGRAEPLGAGDHLTLGTVDARFEVD